MTKQVFDMLWQRDHIIEHFESWRQIAKKSLRLFVEKMDKACCVRSIFGNQFRLMLMYTLFVLSI